VLGQKARQKHLQIPTSQSIPPQLKIQL